MNRDDFIKDIKTMNEHLNNMYPKVDIPGLGDFLSKGNDIKNLIYLTRTPALKNIPKLRTEYGMLQVQYSRHVPYNIIMKKSPNFSYRGPKDE